MGVMVKEKVARFFMDHGVYVYLMGLDFLLVVLCRMNLKLEENYKESAGQSCMGIIHSFFLLSVQAHIITDLLEMVDNHNIPFINLIYSFCSFFIYIYSVVAK